MRVPVAVALAWMVGASLVLAQRLDVFIASRDHPAIAYGKGPVNDPVADLNKKIEQGGVRLAFDAATGYLRSTLDALGIPVESQVLVFSQTSSQAEQISPENPRAVYFGDSVAVGWVRGGSILEVAAQDRRQGVIFYKLDQRQAEKPRFQRDDNTCLACHLTWDTLGVPGMFVLSTFPMSDDKNAYARGFVSDHRSPLPERWGGWYVTGHSPVRHMGNARVIVPAKAEAAENKRRGADLDSLASRFDTTGFLSQHSDLAALMVLEHQTRMTNLLTRLGWEDRVAAYDRQRPARPASEGTGDRVNAALTELVDYLLFVDEDPLPGAIRGSSGFASRFASAGPRDAKGRSLRELDLQRRLMRYPCSYMIYSEAFDALSATVKNAVYERMWRILSGQEKGKPYDRLARTDRQAVVEILRDTQKDLPQSFRGQIN